MGRGAVPAVRSQVLVAMGHRWMALRPVTPCLRVARSRSCRPRMMRCRGTRTRSVAGRTRHSGQNEQRAPRRAAGHGRERLWTAAARVTWCRPCPWSRSAKAASLVPWHPCQTRLARPAQTSLARRRQHAVVAFTLTRNPVAAVELGVEPVALRREGRRAENPTPTRRRGAWGWLVVAAASWALRVGSNMTWGATCTTTRRAQRPTRLGCWGSL